MVNENLKTLLIVTSSGADSIFPFLFEFTKHWAMQGRQLLYISKTRIECLPASLGKVTRPDTHILKRMQFMYLPKWRDVLYQVATIRTRRFRVSAIVVDNLMDYFEDEPEKNNLQDHVSHVCASLLFAASIASDSSEPVALVCGYVSQDSTIEQNIVKNFFHNIWEVEENKIESEKTILKLSKISAANQNQIVSFTYMDNHDLRFDKDRSNARLQLIEIVKKIFDE